jgi:hypothetical protein
MSTETRPARPVHPPPPPAPAPDQRTTEVALGTWNGKDGVYEARLIIRPAQAAALVRRAMSSLRGRAEAAGGAVVVLVRRTTKPTGAP